MLTADLVRPRLQIRGSELSVKQLNEHDPHWLQTASELIKLFQNHMGQTQAAWDRALETYVGERIDYVVVRGLAKVLMDAATFTPLPAPLAPVQLREHLFARGPAFTAPRLFHLQVRDEVMKSAANDLGLSPDQLESTLFADRPATYLLTDVGTQWTPAGLIARYNLELARGVLYWASDMRIDVHSSYKDLWHYIKFFKLMFWAEPKQEGGFKIDLDGPISPFVSSTLRYGRQMAAFLPALLLCDRWQLQAHVRPPQATGEKVFRLDYTSALHSHFKQSGEFDSRLEADFAGEFEQKIGKERGHWRLERESEVLLLGDTVMIPDFTFVDVQDEKRRVIVELVGFWHPQYLRRKIEKVRAANCSHMLLVVYKGLNVTEEAFKETASEALFFQQKPVLKEVMQAVESIAAQVYGPRPKQKQTRKSQKSQKPT